MALSDNPRDKDNDTRKNQPIHLTQKQKRYPFQPCLLKSFDLSAGGLHGADLFRF